MQIEYEPDSCEFRIWEWIGKDTYTVTVFDAEDPCDLDNCKTFVLDKMDEMMMKAEARVTFSSASKKKTSAMAAIAEREQERD